MADPAIDIQKMLNALPAMVGYWDRELRNRLANHAYVDFFGKAPEEMRGIHISEVLGPKLYASNLQHMEGALRGEPQLFDREIRTPSGEVRYTQASYIPDEAEDGEVRGFFVLVTDITERRRIEQELERSHARLAEAERLARLGSWDWDIPARRMTCSDGLFEIYGIRAEDFDETYELGGSKYVHPDDRLFVEEEMRQTLETGTPVDFEFRIIRPDGRVRRLHSRAELIAAADGTPLRLTGTAQDVTELHAAAEARVQPTKSNLSKLLSPRQIEILALVADGLSNAEIASRLYLGESTVKWHIRKILKALGVANRAQAVARYLSSG